MRRGHYGFVLLLLAVLGWFAVVRGQINQFSDQTATLKIKNTELESYQQRVADIERIKKEGDVVQRTLTAFYLALPRLSQVPEVLVIMESLGGTSGVVFSALNVGAPSAAEVPVGLTFSGTQNTVNTFLDALDKNVRTATVKNQSLTADKAGNLSVTMQLGLLYQGSDLAQ